MAGATAPTFANLIGNIYARKTECLGKFINKIDMVSQTEWSWWTSEIPKTGQHTFPECNI